MTVIQKTYAKQISLAQVTSKHMILITHATQISSITVAMNYVSFPNRNIFLTFRLDFEDQAHVFRTWSIWHEILKINTWRTYKNIGGGELTA